MIKKVVLLAGGGLFASLLPLVALAQSSQPILIEPAHFGVVRTIQGADLQIATPRASCPAKFQPIKDGPCFDKITLKPAAQGETRVLWPIRSVSGHSDLSGLYGRDYQLFALFPTAEGFQARALELETSDISVPRDCYALKDEGVGYTIEHRKSGNVAVETQTVVCGGGPHQPTAPYRPEGPPLISATNGWHKTESLRVQGTMRYLAVPETCDAAYSIRVTWCAQPAISYMIQNPDVPELDLIAARHSVKAGDILSEKDVDQWVLKRKDKPGSFKADGRWFDKSYLTAVDGCTPVESVSWWVTAQSDGLYINERALNRCGAPLAPVPTEIWEAYGDDYFIVDCGRDWRDGRGRQHGDGDDKKKGDGNQAPECFDSVRGYLDRTRRNTATVVVLNERARIDDHLHDGGYISYDVAEVRLNPDKSLIARRLDNFTPSGVYMSRCSTLYSGPQESRGFVIVRSMGISWARAYNWMSCPVY